MRICVRGTGSQGKSTFIKDFLEEWSIYKTPETSYRDSLKGQHSKKTTKKVQEKILNHMIDEIQKYTVDDNIIFDRGPLDNLAYTMWAYSKNQGDIDDEFVDKCVTLVRETLKLVDIIFYIPITKAAAVEYDTASFRKDKKKGLTDENYRIEIDNIFKAFKRDWDVNPESKFFDPRDKPAIIEIFGEPLERIEIVKLYLDVDGDPIGREGSMDNIVTPEMLAEVEGLKQGFGIEDSQSQAYKNPKGLQ